MAYVGWLRLSVFEFSQFNFSQSELTHLPQLWNYLNFISQNFSQKDDRVHN